MSTPTKTPGLPQGIITPSCDITPTRETAREDTAYDEFALTHQNDCSLSELQRDDAAPTSAPTPAAASIAPEGRARRLAPSSGAEDGGQLAHPACERASRLACALSRHMG